MTGLHSAAEIADKLQKLPKTMWADALSVWAEEILDEVTDNSYEGYEDYKVLEEVITGIKKQINV